MFGLIRHRILLQRICLTKCTRHVRHFTVYSDLTINSTPKKHNYQRNVTRELSSEASGNSELIPKKKKFSKIVSESENKIQSFNERGEPITLTQYSEIELETMIDEAKMEDTSDGPSNGSRAMSVVLVIIMYFFHVPAEDCVFRRQKSSYTELLEMQEKAILLAESSVEGFVEELYPTVPQAEPSPITNEEKNLLVQSLKHNLSVTTSSNFKLIGN